MDEFDAKQRSILEQFKINVRDTVKPPTWDLDDDIYLSRWLIARNFDLVKAEAMLRKSLEVRKMYKMDTLLQTYTAPEVLSKFYIGGVCGFDKDGCPVWIDPFPALDTKGLLHSVTKEQLKLHKMHTCEALLALCQAQTRKLGKPISHVTIVFDLDGLGWKHLWKPGVDAFTEIVSLFEDCYPELLKMTFIINAPQLFVIAYNMIKHVISQRTASKVHVLGSHWKDTLLKRIGASELPVHYGGSMVDPDGDIKCSSKILYGGEVPESYYFTHEDIKVELQTLTIPRGSKQTLQNEINMADCKLKYIVKSEKHDIGFGIMYKPMHSTVNDVSEMETVVAVQRINSHMVAHTGELQCEKPGVYVVVLDNTYSWTKNKKVSFAIEIVSPEDGQSFSSSLQVQDEDEPVTDIA